MGLAKSLYTARTQGQTIPRAILAVFGPHLLKAETTLKYETEEAVAAHLTAGPAAKPVVEVVRIGKVKQGSLFGGTS